MLRHPDPRLIFSKADCDYGPDIDPENRLLITDHIFILYPFYYRLPFTDHCSPFYGLQSQVLIFRKTLDFLVGITYNTIDLWHIHVLF